MSANYLIAGRMSNKDLTRIDTQGQFARSIQSLFEKIRPRKIIETGTYRGTGTTAVIANALRELEIDDARFLSIEINPRHLAIARDNLAKAGLSVELLHGLSVPRSLLPSIEQIEQDLVKQVMADGLIVDHEEADRARLYYNETNYADLPQDMLGQALREFDNHPDFVLLDSGGHMGYIEFRYLIDNLAGPCHIALDDVNHVKHFRSFKDICEDSRFRLVTASEEKFGFCIARFEPNRG
ncbi:MAG TPA: hypothetical protein VHD56_11125 [Tepidisphaeraceae bacterium]|nr:hypothetical protein [Tepidisphaeraceae bacterium]